MNDRDGRVIRAAMFEGGSEKNVRNLARITLGSEAACNEILWQV